MRNFSYLSLLPVALAASVATSNGRFTYYDMPTALSAPCDTTLGPDGAEWVQELSGNKFARIDPDTGAVTEYDIPWTVPLLNLTLPRIPLTDNPVLSCALITGYDGNLYASNGLRNQLVKVEFPSKVVTVFTPPGLLQVAGNLQPLNDITAAPEGIYFTQSTGNVITKFDYKTHSFKSISLPTPLAIPVGIYFSPEADKSGIWFCEFGASKIGRMDIATQHIVEYRLPASLAGPIVMRATTKQRYLYFASTLGNAIGRIDVQTRKIDAFPIPTPLSTPVELCASDAGDIWFTHILMNALGRLTPSTGKFEEVQLPGTLLGGPISLPLYVGSGIFCKPGNAVWFTEATLNRAGRYQL